MHTCTLSVIIEQPVLVLQGIYRERVGHSSRLYEVPGICLIPRLIMANKKIAILKCSFRKIFSMWAPSTLSPFRWLGSS